MSFGKHQYQHRYFNYAPHKKILNEEYRTYQPSLINSQKYIQQQFSPHHKDNQVKNSIPSMYKKTPEVQMYRLGQEGPKIKECIADKFGQDYRENRQVLERFRIQSEQYRKRKRFGSKYQIQSSFQKPKMNKAYQQYLENSRMGHGNRRNHTQPQKDQLQYQQRQNSYYPDKRSHLQEKQVMRYNVGVMARIEKSVINHHLQHQTTKREKQLMKQNEKLKEYKKKYKILKNKLHQQMLDKKITQFQLRKRQQDNKNKEKKRFESIQNMIHDISDKLQKKSIFLNERITRNSYKQKDQHQGKDGQNMKGQIYSEYQNNIENYQNSPTRICTNSKILSQQNRKSRHFPKVVYTQSEQLQTEINKYNSLMKNNYK